MKTSIRRASIALTSAAAVFLVACGGGAETDTGAVDETSSPTETATATDTETAAATESETSTEAAQDVQGTVEGTLVIWADEKRVETLQTIAADFTEATGVDLVVELVPSEDMRDQVTQAAPAGEGPDVFTGAHDWTGELAANGVIAPVDLSGKADQIDTVAVNAFGFEGSSYALPYITEAVGLYYNKELVGDTPPATFDELAAFCEAEALEQCLGVAGGGGTPDAYHNYPFISGFGGTIFAYDEATGSYDPSTVRLDDPATIQGAEFLATQVEAGIVEDVDYDTAKNLFLEGTTPFLVTGPWELGDIRDSGVDYGVGVIPQIGDAPAAPFVGAQGFYVSQFSENALLAQTFLLDYLATDEVMQALYDADPRGTAWKSVAEGLGDDPDVQTFAESASNGIPMPNIPEMAAVWGPLGDNVLRVRSGEAAGEEAMTTAADAVRQAVEG